MKLTGVDKMGTKEMFADVHDCSLSGAELERNSHEPKCERQLMGLNLVD